MVGLCEGRGCVVGGMKKSLESVLFMNGYEITWEYKGIFTNL